MGRPQRASRRPILPIQMEVEDLEARNKWTIVNKADVPEDAKVLGGRSVYAIKTNLSRTEVYKIRFAPQGHNDCEKHLVLHSSTAPYQFSISLIVSIATVFYIRIWTHDVTQAYL